jgi:glucan endo-1,3-alpha-glucosidase
MARSFPHASSTAKPSVFSSASISATTSARLTKASSGPKLVVAHFIVGNTYVSPHHISVACFTDHRTQPYTSQDWLNDINLAHAKGIDAFALNFGVDPWQPAQLDSAVRPVL